MADPENPIHGRRPKPPEPVPQPPARAWSQDDIVVALFAFLAIGGAIYLSPNKNNTDPTLISFLLATGIAALTYRYLGGIDQKTSLIAGATKLSGTLAALVGIAMIIHHLLVSDLTPPPAPYQAWVVYGQVTDEHGDAIEPLDAKDLALSPPLFDSYAGGKFKLNIYSFQNENGSMAFPILSVSHSGDNNHYDTHLVDLNPDAQNDVDIKRSGRSIVIKQIRLHSIATPLQPQQALLPVADESRPLPAQPEVHH
jgi:hypothetical protein